MKLIVTTGLILALMLFTACGDKESNGTTPDPDKSMDNVPDTPETADATMIVVLDIQGMT